DWSTLAGRLTPHETAPPSGRTAAPTPPPVSTTGQGPGDLTLASIVLFTLGAYGVAAGAATGQEAVVAVGVFAFTLFVVGIVWPVPGGLLPPAGPVFTVGGGDTVRAVRPYVPGDPARLVHWPTSARRGELVVREHEPPPALGVALVVDLRGLDPEDAASRAMGIGQSTLAAGGVVWCGTSEADGAVGEIVPDVRTLGRRLAR